MSECIPCKQLAECLRFGDFDTKNTSDKLYLNQAQSVTVVCDTGNSVTVQIPAGVIGFVLPFQLGNPPYPDLTLNCGQNFLEVTVPDDCTQAELDLLITSILNQCAQVLAKQIGCAPGLFFNSQQQLTACAPPNSNAQIAGAVPNGVTISGTDASIIIIAAGTISSTISQADADAKAIQLLKEIVLTGNIGCGPHD